MIRIGVVPKHEKRFCSECGAEMYSGDSMYYHIEDNPYRDDCAPVYCTRGHIERHTICGEKL